MLLIFMHVELSLPFHAEIALLNNKTVILKSYQALLSLLFLGII